MFGISRRLLPALQLTRMALVFTALADSFSAVLLLARFRAGAGEPILPLMSPGLVSAVALMSIGLYGFGMSLNDIIDRRRDRQIAAERPLPSGRISLRTAYLICGGMIALALIGGFWLLINRAGQSPAGPAVASGWLSLLLIVWTAWLIAFYDFAGKYLVAPGLITLGLIRFFHAVIPAPEAPLIWHPLWLMSHVAILSAIAYALEAKRPRLTRGHWWAVLGGVGLLNALMIGAILWRRYWDAPGEPTLAQSLWITPGLLLPLLATIVFVLIGWWVRRRAINAREAGRRLMLLGLLWLIVYDAAFVAGYVGWVWGGLILLLLPAAYLSVRLMRGWSKLLSLSQRPTFKRVEID